MTFFSWVSFAQGSDFTFCYGSISLTLKGGGRAEQVRYGTNGSILKRINGEWTAYGSPNDMPGQTIKIEFNSSGQEYSYTLIRDGFGNPSKIIDNQGRNYSLCKKKSSSNENSSNTCDPQTDLSFFIGTYKIEPTKSAIKGFVETPNDIKIIISNSNGQLRAKIFKGSQLLKFFTTCKTYTSDFIQFGSPNRKSYIYEIDLTPEGCNEKVNPDTWLSNYITLTSGNSGMCLNSQSDDQQYYYYLNIDIKRTTPEGKIETYSGTIKKVSYK